MCDSEQGRQLLKSSLRDSVGATACRHGPEKEAVVAGNPEP